MRKTVIVAGSLMLAGLVLFASVLSQSGMVTWQPGGKTAKMVEYSSRSAQLFQENVPKPVSLPGNPFYLSKMLRDRLWLLTTINPKDRTLLLINLSDKRAEVAYFLAFDKQIILAQHTMMKAYQYLEAAGELIEQKVEDEDKVELKLELVRIAEEQSESVRLMADLVEGDARITFDKISESYKGLWLKNQPQSD